MVFVGSEVVNLSMQSLGLIKMITVAGEHVGMCSHNISSVFQTELNLLSEANAGCFGRSRPVEHGGARSPQD